MSTKTAKKPAFTKKKTVQAAKTEVKKPTPKIQPKPAVEDKIAEPVRENPAPVMVEEVSEDAHQTSVMDSKDLSSTTPEVEDLEIGDSADTLVVGQTASQFEKRNISKYIIAVTAVIVAVLGVGGMYFFMGNESNSELSKTPVTVTQTPIPSAVPAFKRSDISFEVLNGSGVKGAAKKAADKLKLLGYDVVKTGNASKTYKESVVLLGEDAKIHDTLIMADMINEFAVASQAGDFEETTPSAQLILGTE